MKKLLIIALLLLPTIVSAQFNVPQGGTGKTSFPLGGWIFSQSNQRLGASSSPTVGWLTATSTATSTFAGGIQASDFCTALRCLSSVSTGAGLNYWTNSGATTTLNTGSVVEAGSFNATSTTATSAFYGNILIQPQKDIFNNFTLLSWGNDDAFDVNGVPYTLNSDSGTISFRDGVDTLPIESYCFYNGSLCLTDSQWEDITGGISYNAGNVFVTVPQVTIGQSTRTFGALTNNPSSNTPGMNLVVKAGDGVGFFGGSVAGGSLTLMSGKANVAVTSPSSGASGGDINLYASSSVSSSGSAFNGGNINITAGQGAGTNNLGGNVVINGGTGTTTGNVNLATAGGNVGIGTTSPYAKLSVVGQVVGQYFTATSSTASQFSYASTTAISISSLTSDRIPFVGTGGLLKDEASFNYTGSTLYSPSIITSGSLTAGNISSAHIRDISNLELGDYNDEGVGTYAYINVQVASNRVDNYVGTTHFSGDVGLGTTTPGTKLSIGNTGNDTISISPTATSTFGTGINLRSGCFAISGTCIGGGSSTGASTTLLVDSNTFSGTNNNFTNNLGVGTSSPYAKLSVAGQVVAGYYVATSSTASAFTKLTLTPLSVGTSLDIFDGSASGSIRLGADVNNSTRSSNVRKLASITAPDYGNTRNIEFISSDSDGSGTNKVYLGGRSGASTYAATDLYLNTATNPSTTGGTTAAYINSSGNMGIGTTTLLSNTKLTLGTTASNMTGLTIKGVTSQAADYLNVKDSAGTSLTRITPGGGILIGSGAGTGYTYASVNGPQLDISYGGVPNALVIGAESNLSTRTNNTSKVGRMALAPYSTNSKAVFVFGGASNSTNNLLTFGGGTSVLQAATQVDFYTAVATNTDTGTSRLTITNTGKIGIHLTTPDTELHVSTSTLARATAGTVELLKLSLPLNGGVAYPQAASFALGTYSNNGAGNGYGPDTRLDIKLKTTSATDSLTDLTVMTMLDNGNVGVGTTTPMSMLSVAGTITSNNINATSTTATSTFSGHLIQGSNIVSSYLYPSFTYATSTAWTGTTTIPLGVAFNGETWRAVKCFTDVGTVNVSINDGTNRMNMFNASTTVGNVTLSTNNQFTASEKRYVDIGTPATAPTKLSCTVQKTLDLE